MSESNFIPPPGVSDKVASWMQESINEINRLLSAMGISDWRILEIVHEMILAGTLPADFETGMSITRVGAFDFGAFDNVRSYF